MTSGYCARGPTGHTSQRSVQKKAPAASILPEPWPCQLLASTSPKMRASPTKSPCSGHGGEYMTELVSYIYICNI